MDGELTAERVEAMLLPFENSDGATEHVSVKLSLAEFKSLANAALLALRQQDGMVMVPRETAEKAARILGQVDNFSAIATSVALNGLLAASGQDQRGAAVSESHHSGASSKFEAGAKQSAPHQPKAAAGQVSSHKDTDETGGAANPASAAAPNVKTMFKLGDDEPSSELLRGIALGLEASVRCLDEYLLCPEDVSYDNTKAQQDGDGTAFNRGVVGSIQALRSLSPEEIAARAAEKGKP